MFLWLTPRRRGDIFRQRPRPIGRRRDHVRAVVKRSPTSTTRRSKDAATERMAPLRQHGGSFSASKMTDCLCYLRTIWRRCTETETTACSSGCSNCLQWSSAGHSFDCKSKACAIYTWNESVTMVRRTYAQCCKGKQQYDVDKFRCTTIIMYSVITQKIRCCIWLFVLSRNVTVYIDNSRRASSGNCETLRRSSGYGKLAEIWLNTRLMFHWV